MAKEIVLQATEEPINPEWLLLASAEETPLLPINQIQQIEPNTQPENAYYVPEPEVSVQTHQATSATKASQVSGGKSSSSPSWLG